MSLSLTPIMVLPVSLAERDGYIQVSRQLFTQWQLEENKNVNISLGQKTITTKAEMIDLPDLQIHVPENILSAFYLPLQAFRFQALFRPETKTLRLGPVIGLLTDFTQKKNGEPNFR